MSSPVTAAMDAFRNIRQNLIVAGYYDDPVKHDLAVIEAHLTQSQPVAWLVTGGRAYKDRPVSSEAIARNDAQARKDGSYIVPLYTAPPQQSQPVLEWQADTLLLGGKRIGNIVPYGYTWGFYAEFMDEEAYKGQGKDEARAALEAAAREWLSPAPPQVPSREEVQSVIWDHVPCRERDAEAAADAVLALFPAALQEQENG